jgi:L,D-transpeptidase-like protein
MTSAPGDRRGARALLKISRASAAALLVSLAAAGVAQGADTRAHRAQLPVGLPGAPGSPATGGPSGPSSPAASGQAAPAPAPAGPKFTVLTDYQQGFGHWAYAGRPGAAIRSGPGAHFRTVGRLHANTEDGLPEVYQVLAEQSGGRAGTWFKVAFPGRPNGRSGWVPASNLGTVHLAHALLVVSARSEHIWLYRDGRLVFSAPVGDGKGSTPTPTGHFWIREKFPVYGFPVYGPFAMGTSDYSGVLTDWPGGGVVGIHGTDQPQLIPGAPSHGCIRLKNADITRLYRLVSVGTPLLVKS